MPQLPFEIPKSLNSYAEQFEKEPAKAISRLKKQLKKRGPDAVGHFLLAWFFHLRDKNEEAVEQALNARIYAPGSPFFQKLHYYLSHPQIFEAWIPKTSNPPKTRSTVSANNPGPVLNNLDSLIARLSKVESKRIRPEDLPEGESIEKKPDDVDDIVSETLASIHEKQGKIGAAIDIYKRLRALNPEKSDYYNSEITRLKSREEYQAGE